MAKPHFPKLSDFHYKLPQINQKILENIERPSDVMREQNQLLIQELREQYAANQILANSERRTTIANLFLTAIAALATLIAAFSTIFDTDEQEIQRLNTDLLKEKERVLQYIPKQSEDTKQLQERIYHLENELKKLERETTKNERQLSRQPVSQ